MIDLNSLSAATLGLSHTVLLGEVLVTTAQATLLNTYVPDGVNLIAIRPNSSLLGLTAASEWPRDASRSPGRQAGRWDRVGDDAVHGTADRYTANTGTTTVAARYSSDKTAGNPAVTVRKVGTTGGEAAAFSYDLAKSVALTRQGILAGPGLRETG